MGVVAIVLLFYHYSPPIWCFLLRHYRSLFGIFAV
jgi:hypothetical protein